MLNFNYDPFDYTGFCQDEAERMAARYKRLTRMVLHDPKPRVGQTPKDIIWTRNKTKLYHFHNGHVKRSTPIMMVYALINRPYILDLCQGNSMVEYLAKEGFDVYLVDWGVPGIEDKGLKLDDFVLDYLTEAFSVVQERSGSEKVSLLGYCMGGTLNCLFTSLHPELPVANMVFLASPIDFSDAGLFTNWLNPETFNVDKMVDVMGNIPAEVIDFGNKMLKPVSNFVSSYVSLWDKMYDEAFVENWRVLNHWVNDGTPFPGESFRQWIKEFYQKNALVKKELFLRGRQVDLGRITCPILNLAGEKDHIVLPNQSSELVKHIGSKDYQFVAVPSGHVSLVVGKQAKKITWPKINEFLSQRD